MNETPLPEPLDEFLNHPPKLPPDATERDALLRLTAGQLQRRRWPRWPIALAGAAAIFLMLVSGFLLLYLRQEASVPMHVLVKRPIPPPEDLPKPAPKVIPAQAPPSPRELEWLAFDVEDDPARVRLYFQAGDSYLDRLDDIQSALRCYRQAIYYSGADDLEINPKDNWLVMALKRDHRKEK